MGKLLNKNRRSLQNSRCNSFVPYGEIVKPNFFEMQRDFKEVSSPMGRVSCDLKLNHQK